ncbi:hypothetical protein AG4045_021720, partial [Apium graveolens]
QLQQHSLQSSPTTGGDLRQFRYTCNGAHCENHVIAGSDVSYLCWIIAGINFSTGLLYLLPLYSLVSLGCYGLLMVGVGLMFPTCPQESVLLQKDIVEAKEFLKKRGVDVVSD